MRLISLLPRTGPLHLTVGFLVCLALVSVNPGRVAAHVLAQDNGTSVVLHIAPDDMPKAAEKTRLEFLFDSDSDNFSLAHCDCTVTVSLQGKTVARSALKPRTDNPNLEGQASVRFPQLGVYDIALAGKSTDGSFPAFRATYLQRVPTVAQGSNAVIIGIVGATTALCAAIILGVVYSRSRAAHKNA